MEVDGHPAPKGSTMRIEIPDPWRERNSPKGRPSGLPWTLRRLTTDLALIAVAVGAGLKNLAPEIRIPILSCGDTPENNAIVLGLVVLVLANIGEPLMVLNDLGEWALGRFAGPGSRRESNL